MEHNATEMKTQVQTYLIEETQELIYDGEKLEQWGSLVKELGLKGQTTTQHEGKSPIPFLVLNSTRQAVLNTLCPSKVSIEDFDLMPIPLPILSLVALSKREGYFKQIEVWYDEEKKDPAVIGITGYYAEYSWYSDSNKDLDGRRFETEEEGIAAGGKHINFHATHKYLIGRWADVKESFAELTKRAKAIYIQREKAEKEHDIRKAQREIEDLEYEAQRKFGV